MGSSLKPRRNLIGEREKLLKKAELAEGISNFREAILSYQLLAEISKELGEFETARQFLERIMELKRRYQRVKRRSLQERKIRLSETEQLELNDQAKRALEIAIIAEEEQRWEDAMQSYKLVVAKNYELGDSERAMAFEEKIMEIKRRVE